jgi:hypothetical protein
MSLAVRLDCLAASKTHVVALGKWISVQPFSDSAPDSKLQPMKVRPLLVDAKIREFAFGPAHDVTDRLFVVRSAFRVNDSLPQESDSPPRWQWQRGGWILVDRISGRVSPINLPEFDSSYSAASWYRDYAAYCGVSEDGKKVYAIVAQISRRKAVLKKSLDGATIKEDQTSTPDSACPAPEWQRSPVRVTFEPLGIPKQTFVIRGHLVDLVSDDEEEAEK